MCAPYLTLWLNPPTGAPAFAVVILAVSELAERAARRQSSSEGKNPLGMRESPEVDELYGRQRPPQESLRHGAEAVGQIRTKSAMARRARTCSQKTSRLEERGHCLRSRLDHPDDRNRQRIGQRRQAVRRNRVAGDHQKLDAVRREVSGAEERVARHRLARARPVGHARGVAEIDGVLAGQLLDQRPQDSEAAYATVEHPDGRVGLHLEGGITAIQLARTNPRSGRCGTWCWADGG